MPKKEKLNFSIDARLLFELGERLVTRKSVALAELIKNAYDADATRVRVILEGVSVKGGTISIADNGNGMLLEHIRSKWMRIGTSDATDNPYSSKFKRPKTGAKGIGRFAAQSLGTLLTLHSVAEDAEGKLKATSVVFDWRLIKSGKNLQSVTVPYTERDAIENEQPGITLVIQGVRDAWTEADLISLRSDLSGLVDPNLSPPEAKARARNTTGAKSQDVFSVYVDSPDEPGISGEITPLHFEGAWAVLSGEVLKGGISRYQLEPLRGDKKRRSFISPSARYPDLIGAKLEIRYFVYRSDFFRGMDINMSSARRLGQTLGGVKIYLDGFRVFPYGDPGDDWLGISASKARNVTTTPGELAGEAEDLRRPMLHLPGNNQLFGYVQVSQKNNPGIVTNVSRERLVDNKALQQLKDFVRGSVDWATIQYARFLAHQAVVKKETAKERGESLTTSIIRLRDVVSTPGIIPNARTKLLAAISAVEAQAHIQTTELQNEVNMLRVLASSGVMVAILEHTLRSMKGHLKAIHADLIEIGEASSIPEPYSEFFSEAISDIGEWNQTIASLADLLGLHLGGEALHERHAVQVYRVAETLRRSFFQYSRDFGINIENQVPAFLQSPPMPESELYAILLNLLTNAAKAVHFEKVRKILISGSQQANGIILTVSDTGTGITENIREDMFLPFVTTSDPDPVLGVGTGLGLKIVKDLVESNGGTIEFVEPTDPWKTVASIKFPIA